MTPKGQGSVSVPCAHCGRHFHTFRSKLKARRAMFCTRKCFRENWALWTRQCYDAILEKRGRHLPELGELVRASR
jgi:hypothetical protein